MTLVQMSPADPTFHLALALRGDRGASAATWLDRIGAATAGMLDFVTLEDPLLDPTLLAARLAPRTQGIGLVPAAVTSTTEPFLVSSAIATLDFVTRGRAGWLVAQARPGAAEDDREAADHVEVVRRLWDSWEDDAIIRDAATSRFLDRDRLHPVRFEGPSFSVLGPSITPRPPQGQALVVARAGEGGAAGADVVLVAEPERDGAGASAAPGAAHRFADLTVSFDPAAAGYAGDPGALADRLLALRASGITGARLAPADPERDLDPITTELTAALRERGAFRDRYAAPTLRGLLGLSRPANRYATR
jgi:alkanesulfonate monooxygenase SsuD/methylene tetrahydromethanopterin reductase-like flavin-dependent oxidoreductase (luciferase family)